MNRKTSKTIVEGEDVMRVLAVIDAMENGT